jgi:hypothetical protein
MLASNTTPTQKNAISNQQLESILFSNPQKLVTQALTTLSTKEIQKVNHSIFPTFQLKIWIPIIDSLSSKKKNSIWKMCSAIQGFEASEGDFGPTFENWSQNSAKFAVINCKKITQSASNHHLVQRHHLPRLPGITSSNFPIMLIIF